MKISKVSVIVPSYKRPVDLRRCLAALASQAFREFATILILRREDHESHCVYEEFMGRLNIELVTVEAPGVIAALTAGLARAGGDVIVFTDDDSEAPREWLSTLVDHLNQHPECGAVGGRDWLQLPNPMLSSPLPSSWVGRHLWTGKSIGNHHCPITKPYLKVQVLKGVNMAFRRELIHGISLGDGLRGGGTTVNWEHYLCAAVRRQRKELHFLRDATIKHHIGKRMQQDDRTDPYSEFARSTYYNNGYVLGRFFPFHLCLAVFLRSFLIGNRNTPGLLLFWFKTFCPKLLYLRTRLGWSGVNSGWRDR